MTSFAGPAEGPEPAAVKAMAITALLEDAERRGLALSPQVNTVVENLSAEIFDYSKDPGKSIAFSRTLKDTAVRLFRQRRYREADTRYRLAARFNPTDPTLVSNRATCMYNLAKNRKCIDLCLDCVTAFPTLGMENPMLYFKVLLRMGRANIELERFTEAQATYDALSKMRDGFNSQYNSQIPQEQLSMLLDPFARHLKAKQECFEQNKAALGSSPEMMSPKLSTGRHHNDDNDDDDDDDDNDFAAEIATHNLYGYIEVGDLCPHLHEKGRGHCNHDFPELSRPMPDFNRDDDDDYGEPDLADSEHSDNSSVPTLISSSHDDDDDLGSDASSDSNMPDLVSDEEDYSGSSEHGDGNKNSSAADPPALKRNPDPNNRSSLLRDTESRSGEVERLGDTSRIASGSSAKSKSKTVQIGKKKKVHDGVVSGNLFDSIAAIVPPAAADSVKGGFKRGFLSFQDDPASPSPAVGSASNQVADMIAGRMSAALKDCAKIGKRNKFYLTCYESDQEQGPLNTGLRHERTEEDDAILNEEKKIKQDESKNWMCIGNVLREVMGKSFHNNRTVDFPRIFGHHVAGPSNSKRKKKSCDKNCGTCFARKMWKMRFFAVDFETAEAALSSIENDSRRERQTFLSSDLWQGTGYYASGYELAFDVPALVHGVAYMCHLQSELYWRGDKVTFLKDAQHSFIASLERNYRYHPNKDFIFMIFMLIRDTVRLFGLFPDPMVAGARRSFQFAKSAANIAENLFPPNVADGSQDGSKYNMLLASRSENLSRNMNHWSRLGQVAKEEEWIYHILLRDVSHLISKITSPVTKTPIYLEEGESFSEAFEKACGDRTKDETNWRCRMVTIVSRERSRMIERTASKADDANDTEISAQLLSNVITCRPRQPRLYLRRAQIYAQQKKWKDSLSDIRKALILTDDMPQEHQAKLSCNPPPQCLKVDLFSLESDVYYEEGKEPGNNSMDAMHLVMKSVNNALACHPKEKNTTEALTSRLEIAKWYLSNMESQVRPNNSLSQQGPGKDEKASTNHGEPGTGGKNKSEARKSGTYWSGETDRDAAASKDGPSSAKRSKLRKSKKPQQRVIPKPAEVPIQPASESSSSDEGQESSLAGNPYAALLDDGVNQGTQISGTRVPISSVDKRFAGRVNVPKKTSRGQPQAGVHGQGRTGAPLNRIRGEVSSASIASGIRLECHLCGIQFSGKSDFDSHMKGRRHRTAVANARAAGQTPAEWRERTRQSELARRSPGLTMGSERASSAADGRRFSPSIVHGPTRDEALTEVERAIAILGGEARPCDILPRMRFSKWNIRDVNTYLERKFGGLLRLCLQNTQMFEIRPGTESRPVLVWIDPNGGASGRSAPQHRVASSPRTRTRTVSGHDGRVPNRSQRNSAAMPPSNLNQMLRDQLLVSTKNQQRGASRVDKESAPSQMPPSTVMDGSAECGICYDNLSDIRLIPCGHEWCTPCIAENIIERGRNECPVCRQLVQRTELVHELD